MAGEFEFVCFTSVPRKDEPANKNSSCTLPPTPPHLDEKKVAKTAAGSTKGTTERQSYRLTKIICQDIVLNGSQQSSNYI